MALFKRARLVEPAAAGTHVDSDASAEEALRLLGEGNAFEDEGRLDRAMQCDQAAIRLAPTLPRGHLNRGNILLAVGDTQGAVDAFATALVQDPDYAPAHFNMGNAYVRSGRPQEALAAYRKAIAARPDFVDAEVAQGSVLEDLGQPEAAVASYRRALTLNPQYAEVHNNLGNALRGLRQLDDAVASHRRALAIKPELAAAHYGLGNALQDLGQLDAAVASYRRALEISPDYVEAHHDLGVSLQGLGQTEGAVESYRRAVAIRPGVDVMHFNLGNALRELGKLDDAVASYRRTLEINPNLSEAHCNLGNALGELGKLEDAVQSYRRALAIKPDFAEAHFNVGNALRDLGQLDAATASYQRALEINPNLPEAHSNLGNALKELGQLDAAAASYRRALTTRSDFAEGHFNLGIVLHDLGQLDLATVSYRKALECKSDYLEAQYNLGKAQKDLGRPNDAVASYRRALQIKHDYFEAHNNLGNALLDLGQLDDAAASYRNALRLKPDFPMATSNLLFCLSHMEAVDARALLHEHRSFGERFESALRPIWPEHHNARDPARCLQIGIVSGDLRDHAVAYFIEPILSQLAGSTVLSLHAYYNHAVEGRMTPRLRGYFRHWHAIAGLSDEELAQKIGNDGIDILIDLSGHTAENRLLCFARKPAPIQASWMGYPGTTGLTAMDYYVADRYFLPPGSFDDQFTEKLVYLPANAPFLPHEGAPAVNALPALTKGYATFGSFNRIGKLSRSAIALWSRLLRALPNSRMLLGGMPPAGGFDGLLGWFAEEGISRERLSFHPRGGMAAYLALHHQVDMCLDTVPYTGGTTTNHALWMGVPTLTLAGPTAPGRQGAAMLGQVGLDAFVATDAVDFEAKGVTWARDLNALASVRAGLRQRCEQSPIRNPRAIAAGLERALRTMWQRWCAGLPAESIDVSSPSTGR